jgi:hypothetical protein
VPPALTRGSEGVQAITILDEIPGDLGLVLWRAARNVALWAETPADRRVGLFAGAAARARGDELAQMDVPVELRGPVFVLAELLARPGEVDVFRLVNACRRVSLWAEQRGSLSTAIEFAQAAAQASPESASLAYGVGRLARRRAEYDRAESWYGRAAVQGRASADWRSYALAFSGMANLSRQKGNYPAARRFSYRCLNAAEAKGLLDVVGSAYHDLFVIAIETDDDPRKADALAASALRAYGPRDSRVPRLAYDLAYNWAVHGDFAASYRLAQTLMPWMHDDAQRAMVLGLLARSAAGLGDREAFLSYARQTRLTAERDGAREMAARALLGVVYGAAHVGECELGQDVAARALTIARSQSEGRVIIEIEAAVESLRRVEVRKPAIGSDTHEVERLASSFIDALRGPVLTPA